MFTYEEILGNEGVVGHIKYSILSGTVSHAYIFHGQAGLGKKTIAGTFAKALQCIGENPAPCNRCVSCFTMESGNHPDILYVKATKTKALGVEDIREQVNGTIHIKPYRYPYKIYIIPKADTMTAAAQNALLKTIEEPPDYGVFMLLTDYCDALLPTVISRCIRFKLQPLSHEQIEAHLISSLAVSPEKASFFSAYAQGNMGRAIALAQDENFVSLRNSVLDLTVSIEKKVESQDLSGLLAAAKEFENYKDDIQEVLDIFVLWHRDLLIDKIKGQERSFSIHASLNKLGAISQAKRRLLQNGNFQMTIESMLLDFLDRGRLI